MHWTHHPSFFSPRLLPRTKDDADFVQAAVTRRKRHTTGVFSVVSYVEVARVDIAPELHRLFLVLLVAA